MKKLVVKSRLVNKELFEARLAGIGMGMSGVIWQHERVYVPSDWRPNANLPRLITRTEVQTTEELAKYYLFLKRHIEDSGVDWVNCSKIENYTEVSGIIHQLGFKKIAEVSRQRRELWLDNRTVIYLDEVEGVNGTYLKIEAELDEEEPVEALRQDLFKILKMFGQEKFSMDTYFDILRGKEEEFLLP